MWCLQDQLWDNINPIKYELIISEVRIDHDDPFPYPAQKHIVKYQHNKPFNKSWCINNAVNEAEHPNLLILDADIRFGSDYLQKVIEFAGDKRFFMGFNVARLDRGTDNMHRRTIGINEFGACGLSFFIKKDLFWEVGGGNEKYFGYGNEDVDLFHRIKHTIKFGHPTPALDYEIEHTYHHWHREDSNYPMNKDNVTFFNMTKDNLDAEITKLKKYNLGGDTPCEELKPIT